MDENQLDEIQSRRQDEIEALQAFYGHQLRSTLSSPHHCNDTSGNDNDEEISMNGPWFIELIDNSINSSDNNHNFKIPTLEIRLPSHYPLSQSSSSQNSAPPTPILHNVDNHNLLSSLQKQALIEELIEMYEPEMDMAIMWAERCREEFLDVDFHSISAGGAGQTTDDGTVENDNSEKDATISIRFVTFNHLLYGKAHKKEAQIISLASKSSLFGFIVYGTPGIIGLLAYNGDNEDIVDFAKECSSRIGKRATVLDYELKVDRSGGLLSSLDDNVNEDVGGSNMGGKSKKGGKSKGSDSNANKSNTSLLSKLLGDDRVTVTNDSVSINANSKSGLRHFDSIRELSDVLSQEVIQTIIGL